MTAPARALAHPRWRTVTAPARAFAHPRWRRVTAPARALAHPRWVRRGADASAGEEGSILPLTLGYVVLALVVVLVCVNATSLYLAQKRVDALADGAALAGSDGFVFTTVDGEPIAQLTDAAVSEQAETFLDALQTDAVLVSAASPDGVSSRVTVAAAWHPPVVTLFVPDGVRLEATATSRTVLR
ncbi:pilus assembly protein TadG-related protein [Microbacterium aquimaris]|uniref:pilus assembly protein TadG-related protein n=1 Tax=Microbacterium aquimaris TaxID=459816 RepID=UPI002AD22A72|nr:pilus assembly protein TadG-related protein [Microbacterium aquimaris]MDZ8275678.1 pilus assembly protein TadG-related protein [Microbacterium aquimaris]